MQRNLYVKRCTMGESTAETSMIFFSFDFFNTASTTIPVLASHRQMTPVPSRTGIIDTGKPFVRPAISEESIARLGDIAPCR